MGFVGVTLIFVDPASRTNKTASDYYVAGRRSPAPVNGVAISGDYLSAASFLGIAPGSTPIQDPIIVAECV